MSTFAEEKQLKINIIGDIFCDVVASGVTALPKWGEDSLCSRMDIFPGGSGLNTSCHMATVKQWKCIDHVMINLFSRVGADFQSELCISALAAKGIDYSGVITDSSTRTGSCVVISGSDDRGFLTDRGAMDDLSIQAFDENTLLSCSHLHIAGFYNCKCLMPEVPRLFATARSRGITTSLNPQFDATMKWDGIEVVCPHLSVLIANTTEIISISAEDSIDSAAKTVLLWGCEVVVVTQGAAGAIAFCIDPDSPTKEVLQVAQASPTLQSTTDTTGAGDAFNGAFLLEWIQSKETVMALKLGCISGAAATCHLGGSTSTLESLNFCESLYS